MHASWRKREGRDQIRAICCRDAIGPWSNYPLLELKSKMRLSWIGNRFRSMKRICEVMDCVWQRPSRSYLAERTPLAPLSTNVALAEETAAVERTAVGVALYPQRVANE